ncbi:FUSC family protein [Pseudonocardia endophytica]|uniref:Putative membrane protein YccC n=1 Tax=Pseudonocardia endophytica TaxID=401976 RepID=A0A4R1HYH3_PSEEN|nr:FUSC family protein [Pseudonocardia endophytica]TCK27874.1 putative membrane protein YccC [Pseudonocardia endophytica]
MTPSAAPVVRRAVRVSVAGLIGFYLCLYVFDDPVAATYAMFGVVALGVFSAEVVGTPRRRSVTLAAASVAGAVLVTLGTLLAVSTAAAVAGMLVVGFAVAYAGTGGPRLVGAANGLHLLYVLPCFPPFAPDTLGQRLGGLALGAVLLILTDRYLLPPTSPEPVADRIARLADDVAGYATAAAQALRGSATPDPDRRTAVADEAARLRLTRMATTDRPLSPGVRERSLLAVTAGVRAAADRVVAVADLLAGGGPHPRTADLVEETSRVLTALARALREPERSLPVDLTALDTALAAYTAARRSGSERTLRAGLAAVALAEDVRYAALAATGFTGAPRPSEAETPPLLWFLHADRARLWWVRLRGHLTPRSVYLQNAVRLALGLAVARLVAGLFDLSHGFWVLLATLSLMRTSTPADRPVLLRAFAGTLAGAVVAAGVLYVVGGDVDVYAWLLPVVMVVAFTIGPLFGVAAAQGGFTVVVAVLFAQLAPVTWRLAEVRLEDVLIGGVIGAVIGAAVWPRGGGGEVRRAGAAALDAVADEIEALAARLSGVPGPDVPDPTLHHHTLMLDNAYQQYRTEPLPSGPAPDWLAVVLVVHRQDTYADALRDRHPEPPVVVRPGDEALSRSAAAVATAYRDAGRAVADGRPPPPGGATRSRESFPPLPGSSVEGDDRRLDGWGWLHGLCDDLSRVERALTPDARTGSSQDGAAESRA